ncbi:MAG: aminomethyl-transferring glycine dehydrogenase [Acidobacteria bacterium]|nr:aminomethyl-transferring glycine dehydrogenase [Acidobacteriota bacterium]
MDTFVRRHVGPRPHDLPEMLATIGAPSLDALIDEAIPASIRRPDPVALPPGESEHTYLMRLRGVAAKNRLLRSCIGMGYYDTITPSVIRRCLFENPSWYTPYTPYQAEIAQGRLESLLNFQTVVSDLTGLPVATASLLDEGTAAGEAMTLLHRVSPKKLTSGGIFLAADTVFPQTLAVLQSRAEPLDIELRVVPVNAMPFDDPNVFGVLLQYPDDRGAIVDPSALITAAHAAKVLVAVATDLLALTVLTPPGELGADIVLGNSQRFGVPLGYGGPHAAFFATRQDHVRHAPGRIIGVSVDAHGHRAYRMALQTREQHIRREKATSNICTAQALLANMAAMYAVYHGPEGLTAIARRVHGLTQALAAGVTALGVSQTNGHYFDTLRFTLTAAEAAAVRAGSVAAGYNLRHVGDTGIGVSFDETAGEEDVAALVKVFAAAVGKMGDTAPAKAAGTAAVAAADALPPALRRSSAFLTHAVFHAHRSESEMMRYLKMLERKDIGLDTSMIALGSCTMKLNAASEMYPVTWPEFSRLHPFVPLDQAEGYAEVCRDLEAALAELTGFTATSLQPNSGAQGELAGLLVIRAWHRDRGEGHRNVVLIPASAHGTNPASAVMAGYKVVVVASDADGNIDVADLKAKAAAHSAVLAALMVTYPSTHGVFEDAIRDICAAVHEHGGQVYMDGANMNAQVGLTSPALIGADVNHINLHKTFAIPHGGGGPGMGPICAAEHLAPYLPGHPLAATGGAKGILPVSAAPWGSASILLISYGYIKMLGGDGVTESTKYAILNANYVKARLAGHYDVLYARANGRVAHEMIFDLRKFKAYGVEEGDVAKRLMDYGFHAPTVSFPVPGTLMIEPTESEDKAELDRFCDALIAIRQEIEDVVTGKADAKDNVLKNAPHTAAAVTADTWTHPYSREQAAYPLPWVRTSKFWPSVGRVDNSYGDRNLVCTCPPMEAYA